VVDKERLLLLKLWGYFRADERKIRKDVLDVLSLILYSNMDLARFKSYISKYKVPKKRSVDVLLEYIDKSEQVDDFIDINKKELDARLRAYKKRLVQLFEEKNIII